MLHGPLSKVDSEAFGSVKEIIDGIAANLVFMQYADSIAQLFLDRFRLVFVPSSVRTYLHVIVEAGVVLLSLRHMSLLFSLIVFVSPHDTNLLLHSFILLSLNFSLIVCSNQIPFPPLTPVDRMALLLPLQPSRRQKLKLEVRS